MAPFKGLQLASFVGSETTDKQGHQKVWVALGAKEPGHHQKTAVANLDCAIVENAFSYADP